MHTTVGVFGGSGYAGMELTRLLAAHPRVRLGFVTSERWQGQSMPASRLRYVDPAQGEALARDCEVVFLATPTEVSLELAPRLLEQRMRVVDLSGAFRLRDASVFRKYYGVAHPAEAWLAEAVYGLPELSREHLSGARLVANPGCYPTACTLALAPLLRAGVIQPSSLILNAASGVTGAGRRASEEYSFAELDGDFRAYKLFRHQHTPELAQALSGAAGRPVSLTFTPHLLPIKRGILVTAYARLAAGADGRSLRSVMADAYGREPFLALSKDPEGVRLTRVVGTNQCLLGVGCDEESDVGRVIVLAAIDNLLKGAAGQAVQNLNAMMGWDETEGLSFRTGERA
jgi:N-acetyl-gamma-glutamyl-phosphate reductase